MKLTTDPDNERDGTATKTRDEEAQKSNKKRKNPGVKERQRR